MKQCPKCGKVYRDFDQYCLVCRYKLKRIEGSEIVDYCPEPEDTSYMKSQPIITCPFCQSTRVSRIGLLSRIASVELWGFASSKIGKQWHCDSCDSDF